MTHLRIEQNNIPETVDRSIISLLYQTALNCDQSSVLKGNLQVNGAYEIQVNYLTQRFSDLQIIATGGLYVQFEDPITEAVCAKYFGDGIGCSRAELASADIYSATTIDGKTFGEALKSSGAVKFNELQYFTSTTSLQYDNYGKSLFTSNSTLTEITLPNSCVYAAGMWWRGSNALVVNNMQALTHAAVYGFTAGSNSTNIAPGYILDFDKFYGTYEKNGYGSCPFNACGNEYIIVPHASVLAQGSSTKFNFDKMINTQTIVFREDFTCTELSIKATSSQSSSVTAAVFLSTQPPVSSVDLNWGPNHVYVPDSSTANYSGVFDQWRTIHTLSDFANISDANKDILIEAGCTVTGSTGNWTVTPPTP